MTKVDGRSRTKTNTKDKEVSDAESEDSSYSDKPEKKKTHPCTDCEEKFTNKSALERHLRSHAEEKPLRSPKRKAMFTKIAALKKHGLEKYEEGTDVYQCNYCDRTFTVKERFRLHVRNHTEKRPFLCPQCPKRFPRKGALDCHILTHSGARPYTCKICDASYRTVANLRTHMMRHRGQRDFACELCDKRFTRRDGLVKHLACTHYDERTVRCSICNKTFKGHINAHLRTHLMEKPHKCSECGARFIQSSQLVVHMRTHTGVKPYTCSICNEAFSYSNVLRLHMRIHTGEKPFKCLLCSSSFVQLAHLKKHMRCIHKKDKPYLCLPCNLFFKTKRELDAHITEENCQPGDTASPEPAVPSVLPAETQTLPAEAATAEGARAELEATTPAEAAIGMTLVKKGRKRKPDAEQNEEEPLLEKETTIVGADSARRRSSSTETPRVPTRGSAVAKDTPVSQKKTQVKNVKTPKKMTRGKILSLRASPENTVKSRVPTSVRLSQEDEEALLDDPAEVDEEKEMPIEVMRTSLCTLLTRFSAPETLQSLGLGKALVDKVLCAAIETSGRTACRDPSLSERECLKRNIEIFFKWTIPEQYRDNFKRQRRSTEDLLKELAS